MKVENYNNQNKLLEYIYLLFFIVVTLWSFLSTTMIPYDKYLFIFKNVSIVLGIGVLCKVAFEWREQWNTKAKIELVALFACLCSYLYVRRAFILPMLILIIGAKGIDFKKILKCYITIVAFFTIVTMGLSVNGLIEMLTYHRVSELDRARYAMGFIYVTDFGAHLFFLCAAWAYLRDKYLKWFDLLGMSLIAIISYALAETRNSSLLIILLVLILGAYLVFQKLDKKGLGIIPYFMVFAMPFFSLIMSVLGYLYSLFGENSKILSFFDMIFGSRVGTAGQAFAKYDITLFGEPMAQVGLGGNSWTGWPANYFFVDCSYVSFLFRFGLLSIIVLVALWTIISWSHCKKKNYVGLIVLFVIVIHCVIEHHLFEIAYNPFWLLLFSYVDDHVENTENVSSVSKLVNMGVTAFIVAFLVELFAFNYGAVASSFGTADSINNYSSSISNTNYTDNLDFKPIDETSVLSIENIQTNPECLYLDLNIYDDEGHYMKDYEYNVTIYYSVLTCDEITGEFYPGEYCESETYSVKNDIARSKYIPINAENDIYGIAVVFAFDDDISYLLNDVSFRTDVPFEISLFRLVCLFLVFYVSMIIFYKFKKDKLIVHVSSERISNITSIVMINKTKLVGSIVLIILFSVLFELFACNMEVFTTFDNEPQSIADYPFYIEGGHVAEDGTIYFDDDETIYLYVDEIDNALSEVYIDFQTPTSIDFDFSKTGVLTTTFYLTDEGAIDYYALEPIEMRSDVEESKYVSLQSMGKVHSLVLAFELSNGYTLRINDIILNANKPMNFNWWRVALFIIALSAVYLLRRNSIIWKVSFNDKRVVFRYCLPVVVTVISFLMWYMINVNNAISIMSDESFPLEIKVLLLNVLIMMVSCLLVRILVARFFPSTSYGGYFILSIYAICSFVNFYSVNQPLTAISGVLIRNLLFLIGICLLCGIGDRSLRGYYLSKIAGIATIIGSQIVETEVLYLHNLSFKEGVYGAYKYILEPPRLGYVFPFFELIKEQESNVSFICSLKCMPTLGGLVMLNAPILLVVVVPFIYKKLREKRIDNLVVGVVLYTLYRLYVDIKYFGVSIYYQNDVALGASICSIIVILTLKEILNKKTYYNAFIRIMVVLIALTILCSLCSLFVDNYCYPLVVGNTSFYYKLLYGLNWWI